MQTGTIPEVLKVNMLAKMYDQAFPRFLIRCMMFIFT
jgi:hypothetical protein